MPSALRLDAAASCGHDSSVSSSSVGSGTLGAVRGTVCAALAVVSLAAPGCGSSEESEWRGPPTAAADGTVPIVTFGAYQESVEEDWERSAPLAAAQFLDLGASVATNTSIRSEPPEAGDNAETVRVELDGIPDHAVRAERWTLRFEPAGDGYSLVAASVTRSCKPGRGHENFSPQPCS
jgi:hypothetical protein